MGGVCMRGAAESRLSFLADPCMGEERLDKTPSLLWCRSKGDDAPYPAMVRVEGFVDIRVV